jgi:hypothetical protein
VTYSITEIQCIEQVKRIRKLENALLDIQSQLERGLWFEERSEIIDFIINAVHASRSQSDTEGKHG